ncbi:MAG: imelysin family protein [Paracoccus sp. (in: a-proteobacteria)]
MIWSVTTAWSDVVNVSRDVVQPAYADLAATMAVLNLAAQADCSAGALQKAYQTAWDSWAGIDYFRLGPVEENGRALAMAFWPDPKSSGQRTQQGLVKGNSDVISNPDAFAKLSVAARGLSGLERLIYEPMINGDEDVLCLLRQATTADLARMTGEIRDEWPRFSEILLSAGEPGNTMYLTGDEARQAIYTQLITGLEHIADTRLGRPLGDKGKPRPELAESRASDRSLRNVALSLHALRRYALALYPDAEKTGDALVRAITMAEKLDDPVFAGAADPRGREKIMVLQYAVQDAKLAAEAEIGQALGIGVGFNSRDGD